MSCKLALVAVSLLLTCGCQTGYTKHIGDEDPGFGETAKYDAAMQIINPDPLYAPGGAQPGGSGAKAAAALKRYRTDAVKQVETMQTTSGTGTGSGSGSTR